MAVTEESVCRYEKLFRKQKRDIARQRIIADLHHRHRCSISHIHIPSLGMNSNAGQKKDEYVYISTHKFVFKGLRGNIYALFFYICMLFYYRHEKRKGSI